MATQRPILLDSRFAVLLAVWLVWEIARILFLGGEHYRFDLDTIYPALFASHAALVALSLATRADPEKWRRFAADPGTPA